jgi:hypothetical protein
MKQVLITENNNSSIVISLESNTKLPGSYINADYNIPEDYKLQQLEAIANKISNNDVEPSDKVTQKYITNTKIISTYDDVINHFKPNPNKYFITGVTDSKASLITKYFKKSDFLKTAESLKPLKKLNFKKLTGDDSANLVEVENDVNLNHLIRTNVKLTIPGLDINAMILSENSTGLLEYILYLDTENPIKYVDLGNGLSRFMFMRSHNETEPTANMVIYDSIIEEPKIISEVFIDRGLNSAFERVKKLKNIKNINELTKTGLGYYKINTKGYNFKTT